jgi:hypothetical protein
MTIFPDKEATMNPDNERNEYTCEDQCLSVADECIARREIASEFCRANFIHCVEACHEGPDRKMG